MQKHLAWACYWCCFRVSTIIGWRTVLQIKKHTLLLSKVQSSFEKIAFQWGGNEGHTNFLNTPSGHFEKKIFKSRGPISHIQNDLCSNWEQRILTLEGYEGTNSFFRANFSSRLHPWGGAALTGYICNWLFRSYTKRCVQRYVWKNGACAAIHHVPQSHPKSTNQVHTKTTIITLPHSSDTGNTIPNELNVLEKKRAEIYPTPLMRVKLL